MTAIEIICVECSERFVFSEKDQDHYAVKGYTEAPKRCKACRSMRRHAALRARMKEELAKTMVIHVCGVCGDDFPLPFPRKPGRIAYCPRHFEK